MRLQQSAHAEPAAQKAAQIEDTCEMVAPIFVFPVPTVTPTISEGNSDNFLASSRIQIVETRFAHEWQRVERRSLSASRTNRLLGQADRASGDLLTAVNHWVNNSISHASDADLYGSRDYWAPASETLSRGRGDCEDFAVLKYQMLAALGVPREDMFLTLARDLARNADHAVLIVRRNGAFYMLDNATDVVLPADQSYDYRATLSYSGDASWLHGQATLPAQPVALAYRSVSATSNPREIGLNR